MNISFDDHIKIKASIYEWKHLKLKMENVLSDPKNYPAPINSLMYYLWAYSFLDSFLTIFKKTIKLEMYNSKKELTIRLSMQHAIAIHLSCRPFDYDSLELARIIMKIDQQLPIEIKKALN